MIKQDDRNVDEKHYCLILLVSVKITTKTTKKSLKLNQPVKMVKVLTADTKSVKPLCTVNVTGSRSRAHSYLVFNSPH